MRRIRRAAGAPELDYAEPAMSVISHVLPFLERDAPVPKHVDPCRLVILRCYKAQDPAQIPGGRTRR